MHRTVVVAFSLPSGEPGELNAGFEPGAREDTAEQGAVQRSDIGFIQRLERRGPLVLEEVGAWAKCVDDEIVSGCASVSLW